MSPATAWERHSIPESLTDLLNTVLAPRNIRVTVTPQAQGIKVTLNAPQKINQAPAVTLVQKALSKLQLKQPLQVELQARCYGIPDWQTYFEYGVPPIETESRTQPREITPFKPIAKRTRGSFKPFLAEKAASEANGGVIPVTVESFFAPSHTVQAEPDSFLQTPPEIGNTPPAEPNSKLASSEQGLGAATSDLAEPQLIPAEPEDETAVTSTPSDREQVPMPPGPVNSPLRRVFVADRAEMVSKALEHQDQYNQDHQANLDPDPQAETLSQANPTATTDSMELNASEANFLKALDAQLDSLLEAQFAEITAMAGTPTGSLDSIDDQPCPTHLAPTEAGSEPPPTLEPIAISAEQTSPEPPEFITYADEPDLLTTDFWATDLADSQPLLPEIKTDAPTPQSRACPNQPAAPIDTPLTSQPRPKAPSASAPSSLSIPDTASTPPQTEPQLPHYTIPKVERIPRDQEAKVVGLAGVVMGVGFCATGLGSVIGLPMLIGGMQMMGEEAVYRGPCPHCGQALKVAFGKLWRFSCPTCQGLVQIKNGRFYAQATPPPPDQSH